MPKQRLRELVSSLHEELERTPEVDAEGRYLEVQFGPLSVVSLYLHSGSASAERQEKKFEMM